MTGKKIVYVDMDNVLVDFASAIPRLSAAQREEFDGRLDDTPGIFALMDPMPGSITAFIEPAGLFDTYVLSTSPWANPSAWAEDRAMLGSNPSADSGPKTEAGCHMAPLSPDYPGLGIGTKAINPGGAGGRPPAFVPT